MKRVSIVLIILAGVALGFESLQGSWHFDDYYTIVRNDALRSPSSLVRGIYDPALFSVDPERPMYRPALVISFVLNYLVLGESVRGFLLINLLLHILNALLVWAVARKLLGEGGELGALAAGLVYVAHPAATEGIAYVSARSAVLATTFTLGSFLAYLKWNKSGKPALLALTCMLFVFGLGAKAIAVTLPAMLLAYHLWFPDESGMKFKKAAIGVGLVSALAVCYVFLRRAVMGVALAESLVRPLEENLLTQARAYMHYLRLYLWPLHQSINPYFRTSVEFSEPAVMGSMAALGALVLALVILWRSSSRDAKVVSFGMLWLLIAFLPESSIVPLNLVISERRMILPLVGFSLIAGGMLSMARPSLRKVALAILILSLASMSIIRLREWRNELTLWRSAVRVDPDWGLLWNNVGLIRLEAGDKFRAMQMFESALHHDPVFKEASLNLGNMYFQSGMYDAAERYYTDALELDMGYEKAAVYLAQLWDKTGRHKRAVSFLEQYVSIMPTPRALYLLGGFAENDLNPEAAARWYRLAVKNGPNNPLPRLALGRLLVIAGKREEAATHLRRFLELTREDDPNRKEASGLLKNIHR